MTKNCYGMDCIRYPKDDCSPCKEHDLGPDNWSACPPAPEDHCSSTDLFAQVLEPSFSASLTNNGSIQLATNASVLNQCGGFTLTSGIAPCDTLNFPECGVYLVTINLDYSFLPLTDINIGRYYQIDVKVTGKHINNPLPNLSVETGITTTNTISGSLSKTFLVNCTDASSAIRLKLNNFNYNVSFNQTLALTPAISVIKLSNKKL